MSLRSSLSPILAVLTLAATIPSLSYAGAGSGGGGDAYTLDFVKTATQTVFPWLVTNGATLSPSVDANEFLLAISPKDISSAEHVFESCDGSKAGREVAACYNSTTGEFFISRQSYPLDSQSAAKIGLVAHEIFRKMGIEGDGYEVTQQMAIAREGIVITATHTIDEVCVRDDLGAKSKASLDVFINTSSQYNPACEDVKNQYYQSPNANPNAVFTIVQSSENSILGHVNSKGEACPSNGWTSQLVYNCTLKIQ